MCSSPTLSTKPAEGLGPFHLSHEGGKDKLLLKTSSQENCRLANAVARHQTNKQKIGKGSHYTYLCINNILYHPTQSILGSVYINIKVKSDLLKTSPAPIQK